MILSNKSPASRYPPKPPKPPLELYQGQSIRFDRELKKWVIEPTGVVLEFRKLDSINIPVVEYR